MNDKTYFTPRKIALTGLLLAIEIILQLFSMIVPGAVNFNLSLLPIIIGALLLGPICGGFLGFASGVVVLCSPNTVSIFMSISPLYTILTCLLKTTIAGVLAGFVFKLLKNKNDIVGSILSSLIVPLFNTLIFAVFCYFFFKNGLGITTFGEVFTGLIGINFIFEMVMCLIGGPILYKLSKHFVKM